MGQPGVAGWLHLLVFGLVVPALVVRSKRSVDDDHPLPPLDIHLASTIATLVLFGAASALAARVEGIELFPRRLPPAAAWAAGGAFLLSATAAMAPLWRRAVLERRKIVALFAPRTGRERALWVSASVAAGVSEEVTWRGVQFALLSVLLDSPVAAAIGAAMMFGAAHLVQGRRAAWMVVAYALAAQALVWAAGSLYIAMAVHTVYDVIAGLSYGRIAEREGYFREVRVQPDASASAEVRLKADATAPADATPAASPETASAADRESQS